MAGSNKGVAGSAGQTVSGHGAVSGGGHTHVVKLIVRAYKKLPPGQEEEEFWADVGGDQKSALYQYRFVPPFGAVHTHIGPLETVLVELHADPGITMHDLRIETDPYHQLRVLYGQCGPHQFVIENRNDHVQVAYYSIYVMAGADILACDPMIFNRPQP